ncbi:AraC family transcriptional regulator [Paenibacillus spongiae]|uniref:AraC family transcriptional regulator n=1 Tax=Paenibacillus spongiae TaxID=2909671 RepID=A0ABY5S1N8_9BACL|nr:AraC family transcriptional regulator [Paenibacillus spongiae]UVI27781.1 AraC family transcriptional regulator [Paenibacillus spongiae]
MKFVQTELNEIISIQNLISLHDFEFSKDFSFQGERHDFWEFLYVDKGEVEVFAGEDGYKLKQGEAIFHKPNEFHGVRANRRTAPNVIVVSFVCTSAAMVFFHDKIFSLDTRQREMLAQVLKNGYLAFQPPFDDPHEHTLVKRSNAPAGTEQLIKIYLELLLVSLLQSGDAKQREQPLSFATKERSELELFKMMTHYMEQHVDDPITLDHICKRFNLSRSYAVTLFRERAGQSIMKYFKSLKIAKAKRMIREEQHNFSQIAFMLNYSNIHNFSRHFKSVTDMSPSEYARSVKAKL